MLTQTQVSHGVGGATVRALLAPWAERLARSARGDGGTHDQTQTYSSPGRLAKTIQKSRVPATDATADQPGLFTKYQNSRAPSLAKTVVQSKLCRSPRQLAYLLRHRCTPQAEGRLKKVLISLLKYGLSLGIVGYLIYDAVSDDTFAQVRDQPKHWPFSSGLDIVLAATCLTFVRWYYLVRALDLPFRMADAFRLGFLGFLLNFVSLGSVGGDLFKAVFIAREQHGKRAEAVATVVIDRVIGLYVLFVVASVAALVTGLVASPDYYMRVLAYVTLGGTIVGGLGIAALVMPGFTQGRLSNRLRALPRVGPFSGAAGCDPHVPQPAGRVGVDCAERGGARDEYGGDLLHRLLAAGRGAIPGCALHHRFAGNAGRRCAADARRAGDV